MFIRRSEKGLLHAVHHNPAIRDHAEGESDAHKALKQRIATAAIAGGLEAVVEDRAAHGLRMGLPRFDGHPRSGDLGFPEGCPASWRA
jgi:hypothetical protein